MTSSVVWKKSGSHVRPLFSHKVKHSSESIRTARKKKIFNHRGVSNVRYSSRGKLVIPTKNSAPSPLFDDFEAGKRDTGVDWVPNHLSQNYSTNGVIKAEENLRSFHCLKKLFLYCIHYN